MQILDKLKNPISVGNYIAYGHALGRCAGLRIGKVLALSMKTDFYDREVFSITVWGIDDDWQSQQPTLLNTKSTLLFPSRIIVLDESQVPSAYKELLGPLTNNSKRKNGVLIL